MYSTVEVNESCSESCSTNKTLYGGWFIVSGSMTRKVLLYSVNVLISYVYKLHTIRCTYVYI